MDNSEEVRKRITVIVATHKAYRMPEDPMYLPVHVGAEGKVDSEGKPLDLGFVKDNTGDNISILNPSFCELTGLYWAWKNLDSDFLGLVHYRRHFGRWAKGDPFKGIITYRDIEPYLALEKVFVPRKRRYYIESLYTHYKHTHYIEQLDTARTIIGEKYPEYIPSFDRAVKRTSGYMFNMMIMRKDVLNEYCSWLFDILFELGNRTDATGYSAFQNRFYGRISEILFNVWLDYELSSGRLDKYDIEKLPFIHMEKVNWFKKGSAFLAAKFTNKKYEGSF